MNLKKKTRIRNKILKDLTDEIYRCTVYFIEDEYYAEGIAKLLLKAIAKNQIKNLKINYSRRRRNV
jgi:hypothetical protein